MEVAVLARKLPEISKFLIFTGFLYGTGAKKRLRERWLVSPLARRWPATVSSSRATTFSQFPQIVRRRSDLPRILRKQCQACALSSGVNDCELQVLAFVSPGDQNSSLDRHSLSKKSVRPIQRAAHRRLSRRNRLPARCCPSIERALKVALRQQQ